MVFRLGVVSVLLLFLGTGFGRAEEGVIEPEAGLVSDPGWHRAHAAQVRLAKSQVGGIWMVGDSLTEFLG